MTTNTVTKYLKFANVQMAAESYYLKAAGEWAVADARQNISGNDLKDALVDGNKRALKFTPALATDFTKYWKIVEHKANTGTGFSGTLFQAIADNADMGIKANELVLSFRSTEFADDAVRDNQATNKMEVTEFGFAIGQIADTEDWFQTLRTRALIGDDAKLSVTGYSLGGHLANTKGQSQIVLRGAYMNERSDSMEKKSTPTPGAHIVGTQTELRQ